MKRNVQDLVTVSPPTFDRTAFARIDRLLAAPHAPFARDWLMARFEEGLQIRLLTAPEAGLVLFQPGRLCWRPIEGLDGALVVHDLRVAPGPGAMQAARRLWDAVEDFARFYGFATALALAGREEGLVAPELAPPRGWMTLDRGPEGARLLGRVFHGPVPLPHLPRDWQARTARLGPGAVIQSTGESAHLEARAAALLAKATARNLPMAHERLGDPATVRARAVSPGALFSVVCRGTRIGGAKLSDTEILDAVARGT